jgi:hypothetical protein
VYVHNAETDSAKLLRFCVCPIDDRHVSAMCTLHCWPPFCRYVHPKPSPSQGHITRLRCLAGDDATGPLVARIAPGTRALRPLLNKNVPPRTMPLQHGAAGLFVVVLRLAGDSFGENALSGDGRRNATVGCITGIRAAPVPLTGSVALHLVAAHDYHADPGVPFFPCADMKLLVLSKETYLSIMGDDVNRIEFRPQLVRERIKNAGEGQSRVEMLTSILQKYGSTVPFVSTQQLLPGAAPPRCRSVSGLPLTFPVSLSPCLPVSLSTCTPGAQGWRAPLKTPFLGSRWAHTTWSSALGRWGMQH